LVGNYVDIGEFGNLFLPAQVFDLLTAIKFTVYLSPADSPIVQEYLEANSDILDVLVSQMFILICSAVLIFIVIVIIAILKCSGKLATFRTKLITLILNTVFVG